MQSDYLKDLWKKLAEKTPDHPLVAVFQSYFEEEDEKLAKNVHSYYDQIQQSLNSFTKIALLKPAPPSVLGAF